MTGKKSFAGKAHDHASTDTHHAHPAPDCRSWASRDHAPLTHVIHHHTYHHTHRPDRGGSTVESLADVLPMLAFFYLAAAVLQRRQAT